jgi:thiol:disulfide interchange protein DsbC
MYRHAIVLFSLFLLANPAIADQDQDIVQIKKTLKALGHDESKISDITVSPIPGFYEVLMGPNLTYFSADGRYMMLGDLVDTKTYKNLSVPRRNAARTKAIDAVGEENMFVFAPEKEPKHTINVFTDIDCGYCRKLHREIGSYNENGIKVRYLMFPRAGKDSKSYEKAVDAWCATDRNAALTKAKKGERLDRKDCPNPVQQHMALGELMGVTGTPTIITDTGEILPGYVPAASLAKLLENDGSRRKLR